jgi:hypothetical protein
MCAVCCCEGIVQLEDLHDQSSSRGRRIAPAVASEETKKRRSGMRIAHHPIKKCNICVNPNIIMIRTFALLK